MASSDELLRLIALHGIARPASLRAELGVSAQTLGRLIASAGESVLRIGKGPATQYARTRAIAGLGSTLPAFTVDEAGKVSPAGTLHLLGRGRILWREPARSRLFEGLPPELVDMAPQGYLGHGFSARHADLGLPQRTQDWSNDHRLIALARRGEDCVGNVIIGDESLQRFLQQETVVASPENYPALAIRSATEVVGSSAGGERPKFGVYSGGRHLLVKFARAADSAAAKRWSDLLWCEWKALQTIASAGRSASPATCVDVEGWRFLEVERFDRAGRRGRRATLSLFSINNAHFGETNSWTTLAPLLRGAPLLLPEADADALRWLDVFGQLIGNTDRHFENVSFFVEASGRLRLAPAYDMLPMVLAPSNEVLVERAFDPQPPTGRTLDVWEDAARWAEQFWVEVREHKELDQSVRSFAARAAAAVANLRTQLGSATPLAPSQRAASSDPARRAPTQ